MKIQLEDSLSQMLRSFHDKGIFVLVTVVSNLACLPALLILMKKNATFEVFVSCFTLLASFMYHLSDSLEVPLWMSELQWHRLDNIGAIQCFIMVFIFMAGLQDLKIHLSLNFGAFLCVLVLQEMNPWDLQFTLAPILITIVLFTIWMLVRHFNYSQQSENFYFSYYPKYDLAHLSKGLAFMSVAFYCFICGLDDANDTYRIYHGCWHAIGSFAMWYLWQVLPRLPASGVSNFYGGVVAVEVKDCV